MSQQPDHGQRRDAAMEQKLQNVKSEIEESTTRQLERQTADYKIGIVTAIPIESNAIRKIFDWCTKQSYGIGRQIGVKFEILGINVNGKKVEIVHCRCAKMGNNSSAVATALMLERYRSVKHIIMCGIAGGIPNPLKPNEDDQTIKEHVRLGDVVISNCPIVQYDLRKMQPDSNELRAIPTNVCAVLKAVSEELQDKIFAGDSLVDNIVEDCSNFPQRPANDELYDYSVSDSGKVTKNNKLLRHPKRDRVGLVFSQHGKIGSANILLKNPAFRDQLRDDKKIIAIEMEGAGIADASWTFGVGYIVVRGIVDYCDFGKNDEWHSFAAHSAAAYVRAIVHEFYAN